MKRIGLKYRSGTDAWLEYGEKVAEINGIGSGRIEEYLVSFPSVHELT